MLHALSLFTRASRPAPSPCIRVLAVRCTSSDAAGCNIFGLPEEDFTEKFVRGGGPGGQKINKTNNCVQLKHKSGVMVSCQETRDLFTNRKIARRILRDKLDLIEKGSASKLGKRVSRVQKRKYNAARKAKKKYTKDEESVQE